MNKQKLLNYLREKRNSAMNNSKRGSDAEMACYIAIAENYNELILRIHQGDFDCHEETKS